MIRSTISTAVGVAVGIGVEVASGVADGCEIGTVGKLVGDGGKVAIGSAAGVGSITGSGVTPAVGSGEGVNVAWAAVVAAMAAVTVASTLIGTGVEAS